MLLIETLGIVATLFVIISFIFKDLRMVRSVNMVGSFLFICYGISLVMATGTLLGFISIFLVNGVLLIINTYHLVKLHRENIVDSNNEVYIEKLLESDR